MKVGTWDKKRKTWTILYLNNGTRKRIKEGDIIISGRDELTNVVNVEFARPEAKMYAIKTVWNRKSHDSGVYGSTLLRKIIGRDRKFDFPKSLYSTKDAIQSILRNRPNALIVDFFAGSGTTQQAIDLINAEDGGTRRCICITNMVDHQPCKRIAIYQASNEKPIELGSDVAAGLCCRKSDGLICH